MTGLFEVIAADQSHLVTARRKTVALAAQRVNERFSRFLLASENAEDLEARIGLVEDDLRGVAMQAGDEVGYYHSDIPEAILASYRDHFAPQQKTASTEHTARKPKMCPYHKEVVDISLAQGDPKAGFEAMAQHAWGKQHCQGEFEGGCNFRSEMATQSWWDDRDKAIQERKEQREQDRAQAEQEQVEQLEQVETPEEPVSDSEAPEVESDPAPQLDAESPAEAVTEAPTGMHEDAAMAMAASFREAEAVKTIDVAQRSGPSPKIDKREWTPDNIADRVKTEGEGNPNPTRAKDVTRPIEVSNNDRRHTETLTEIGEAVTEQQDVSKDSAPKPTNKHTWPTGELSAVSASQPDVDRNPLQDLLEDDDGFVAPETVTAALRTRQ